MLSFPVLIGDIGGTNSRFALLETPESELIHFPAFKNKDFESLNVALQSQIFDHTDITPQTAIMAVAGPTGASDQIELTNCKWIIDGPKLVEQFSFVKLIAISDFEAQALAAIALDRDSHSLIKSGVERPLAARCVLGPGTGLGVAGMIYVDDAWVIIPGEGGNVDFGPRTQRDMEIFTYSERMGERVLAESLISGRGLLNIYNCLCKVDGSPHLFDEPWQVTQAYHEGQNAQALEALELFATYFGRFAGDMALLYLARGGVYLTGGVAQRIESVLKQPHLLEAFGDKIPYTDLVSEIPIYLMTDPLVALSGLAAYAQSPHCYRIATQGRQWTLGEGV